LVFRGSCTAHGARLPVLGQTTGCRRGVSGSLLAG
jgi:hypothetical protein